MGDDAVAGRAPLRLAGADQGPAEPVAEPRPCCPPVGYWSAQNRAIDRSPDQTAAPTAAA